MKSFTFALMLLLASLLFTGCMVGNYVSKPTQKDGITQAPMKLRLFRKARWTYYGYSNSAVFMYYENARYKKKGDTVYMRSRAAYGDTSELDKTFYPEYVISGDSLVSLNYGIAYIRKRKAEK